MSQQTCPQCQAEIVGRFHFCLECGAPLELAQALTPPPGMTPEPVVVTPALAPSVAAPTPDPVAAPPKATPPTPAPAFPPPFSIPSSSPADTPSFTPPPFQLDPSDNLEVIAPSTDESAAIEKLHLVPSHTPSPQSISPKKEPIEYLDLTLIRSPDLDSVRFVVKDHSLIGREEGHLIFKDDPYISPLHATLFYRENELFIRDEDTHNGIFIRLSEPKPLSVGETFIAGEQVFVLEDEPRSISIPCQQSDLVTRFFANTSKGLLGFYLTQILDGGQRGAIYPFVDSSITVGRQGCDVNAPLDRFMSSRHCHVSLMGDEVVLTDTGSKNGTFVKVKGEQKLKVGDYILIGKQLLQVQPHQPGSRSKVAI